MKNKTPVCIAVAIITALLLSFFSEAKAAVTALLVGGKGYITQDLEMLISEATDEVLSITTTEPTRVAFQFNNLNTTSGVSVVRFHAPIGMILTTGLYVECVKYSTTQNVKPGLNIGVRGRGNTTIGGYFNILEATYSGNTIVSMAVDGFQTTFDDGVTSGPNNEYEKFSFRMNSEVPLTPLTNIQAMPNDFTNIIPEPSTLTLLSLVGALVLLRRRR